MDNNSENKLDEAKGRRLVPVKILFINDSFFLMDDSGKELTIKATPESFSKFLMKLKAMDSGSYPISTRQCTYMDMVDGILKNKDNIVHVWSTYWNMIDTKYLILD